MTHARLLWSTRGAQQNAQPYLLQNNSGKSYAFSRVSGMACEVDDVNGSNVPQVFVSTSRGRSCKKRLSLQ